ncbi:peptidoglycan-binding protein LysM [Psychroserpens algicola]|uniref:Peptidoglycan-binding protein LysM n=1 Tax=Psychroserpens algicola TaxID=1719034 RepID=A0ABT0HAN1_9FLAO|nr:peptidoglycan-binding protein LysM [Psychroserpens algicola]MCK8481089.1 peptidoglycan-binding protein LysM [Psychroserpens algicola]
MIKKVGNYFVVPLAICATLFMAIKPSSSLNYSDYSTDGLELDYTISKDLAFNNQHFETANSVELSNPFQSTHPYFPYLGKSYIGFKEALAFKESRGNYFSVNTLGYLGKYQFGAETLKMIGIHNPTQFLYNPELQEKAFLANAERNKWILRKDIKRFAGKTINGVLVTESGILAAAHLAGPGSVKKFLRSYGSHNVSDAYGSSVHYYMKKFSGYDTSFIEADRKAKAVM